MLGSFFAAQPPPPAMSDTPFRPPLIILLHGVDGSPADMEALRQLLAARLPHATHALPPAALPAGDGSGGYQWFSVQGITEESRPGRVTAALPAFVNAIRALQHEHGAGPEDTVLVGFSQGAGMSLQASEHHWLAAHVIAISGRFAPLPRAWPHPTAVTLVHGKMDLVISASHSRQAHERLRELGAQVELELVPRAFHLLAAPLLEAAADAVVRALAPRPSA
jgi:phospholipase/carboxylesterase